MTKVKILVVGMVIVTMFLSFGGFSFLLKNPHILPKIQEAQAATTGPNYAGAVGTQGAGWTLGANAVSSVETNCAQNVDTSNAAFWKSFGFAIPTGDTINGIQVEIKASWDEDPRTVAVNIGKNETTLATAKPPSALTEQACGAGQTIFSLGGAADLWGLTWTAADINSANFTVRLVGNAAEGKIFVNWIRVTVFHTAPPPPPPPGGARTKIFGYGPFGGEITLSTDDPIFPRPILSQRLTEATGKFTLELTSAAGGKFNYLLSAKDKEGRQSIPQKISIDIPSAIDYGPYLLSPTLELSKAMILLKERFFAFGFAPPGSPVEVFLEELKKTWPGSAASDGSYSILIDTSDITAGTYNLKARYKVGNDWSSWSPLKKLEILTEVKKLVADFNNDGKITIADWGVFLANWRARDEKIRIASDVNGDGKLSIQDLSIFLAQLKSQ